MNNDVVKKNYFRRRRNNECERFFDIVICKKFFKIEKLLQQRIFDVNRNYKIFNYCHRNIWYRHEKLLQLKIFKNNKNDDINDDTNEYHFFESIVSMRKFKLSNNKKTNVFIRLNLKNIEKVNLDDFIKSIIFEYFNEKFFVVSYQYWKRKNVDDMNIHN